MKRILLFIVISLYTLNLSSQEIVSPSTIKWYTIEKALELSKDNPRPIMIDVYTDWCSWCHFMMKTTFANKNIADYINNNYYAVRFNAETFDTLMYMEKKYYNRKIGSKPTHDFASHLLDGKMSYPSLVFFDREKNKTVIPGYKEAKDIEPILVYFAENMNKSSSLDDFYLNFMFSFPNAYAADHSIYKIDNKLKPDTLGLISWVDPSKVAQLQKKNPKEVMLFFYTDWSIGSKVMERSTFRDRELTKKINEQYYCVKINAAANDTINFLGKTYLGTQPGAPNQLSYAYLNNNFQMPAVVILDKKNATKGMINGFWAKKMITPLLEYFYTDSNKKIPFDEYLKTYKSNQ
jgi:thioredoxin-related protein